jgi:aminobenzoyl-glutamate utilization protein B
MARLTPALALFLFPVLSLARGGEPATTDAWIAGHADRLKEINQKIWSLAEVGLEERESSECLASFLEGEGFDVTRGVAGMPTAFVAERGSGRPIVGILAEYDALPGTSQQATPERLARADAKAGHACGHSVFGTASSAAAAAAAAALAEAKLAGTIRLYGTPAEETGIGKVYMARAGLFDDLDAALHWHAGDLSKVMFSSSKAVISLKYRFNGRSAHASYNPESGLSALDAVELMDVGTNFYREHTKEDARIHYVITDGGGQPNVVPPTAEVWYYLRADDHSYAEEILGRVRDIAKGAALMTGTTFTEKIDSDLFEILPNRPLSELLQKHLERVGPPSFDDTDRAFATKTQTDFRALPDEPLSSKIEPLPAEPFREPASSDVGNVSWIVPTSGIDVACYSKGAPGHSWQIVACTGGPIGEKGMLVAARTLASATLDLFEHKDLLAAARADFEARKKAVAPPKTVLAPDQKAPAHIR